MMKQYRSRRTMLYVPAHIKKHIDKARMLPTDSIIFDLQESVPVSEKESARQVLKDCLQDANFGYSEKVIRINPLNTELGKADLKVAAILDVDAIMFPRVESALEVQQCIQQLDAAGGQNKRVIVNIESPLGVLRAEEIAASSKRIDAIVMGTTDLANELKLNLTTDRIGLVTSLSMVILAARAHHICVVDGPHLDLKNVQACEYSCRQARDLGFDGKTVIHPVQLTYNNDAFTPRKLDVERARSVLTALEDAEKNGRSVAIINDQLIEPSLHIWAKRIINISEQVKKLANKI